LVWVFRPAIEFGVWGWVLLTPFTTQYFGKVYEKIKQNTSTEHKYFIYLDKQLIAIHIKTDTTSTADTADTTNTPASNGFIAIFGHAAISVIGVGSVLVVGMGF
jgi:hypothetical protein